MKFSGNKKLFGVFSDLILSVASLHFLNYWMKSRSLKIQDEQQIVCLLLCAGKEVRGDNEEIKIKGGEGGGGGHSLFHHEGCRSSCHPCSSPGEMKANINILKCQMSQKIAHDNFNFNFKRRQ